MKNVIFGMIAVLFATVYPAAAQHMVREKSYLTHSLVYTGLPDYPPFSYYYYVGEFESSRRAVYQSVFIKQIQKIAQKYGFEVGEYHMLGKPSFQEVILNIRSGESQLFLGSYSETKLFTGIEPIYPAALANPIHIITLPDTQDKIKTAKDLAKLRGVIMKTEYLSDFVLRKIKPLNITYVETPYDAYEALFTGEADYILGSMYYNRIMASRLGIDQYLAYSSKPLFKIPVFVAMSKLTPQFSLYEKAFSAEFAKPEFGTEVKKEILQEIEKEIEKNQGVVPPAFAKKAEPEPEALPAVDAPGEVKEGGKIIEQKVHEKTIEEVLDGI